ncbi:hypothetical protein D3C79_1025430 [compost metagenome]
MVFKPALGELQLASRVTAAHQPIEARQMAVVVAFQSRAQDLLGLDLGTQLP